MIESVSIKDFQSIEDVELDFAPGFNVLVGPSNSGKSAILRAMKGAIRNEIAPSYVRNGARKSSISIKFSDHTVGAERGKALSTYHLDDEDFTKCGKDVPQPIIDVFQMHLVNGEDLNFQFQFDSPFLISASGSTVAQVIGTLTNVTLLFHAVQEANRRYLRASSELTLRLNDIEQQKTNITQFESLEERQSLVPVLTKKLSQHKEITRALEALDGLTKQVIVTQESMPVKVELPELDMVFDSYHTAENMLDQLLVLTGRIQTVTLQLKTSKNDLKSIQEQLDTVADQYCPTCGQKLPDSHSS